MTRAIVVYESMYGNTEQVARAVAEGIGRHGVVQLFEVGQAPAELPADLDLLVVGGPTHAFSMSRPSTREDAATQAHTAIVSTGPGVREWLYSLAAGEPGMRAAAFDTHMDHPRVIRHLGSAANAIEKQLRRRGFQVTGDPTHFWVRGMEGPLAGGELERATDWGESLTALVPAS